MVANTNATPASACRPWVRADMPAAPFEFTESLVELRVDVPLGLEKKPLDVDDTSERVGVEDVEPTTRVKPEVVETLPLLVEVPVEEAPEEVEAVTVAPGRPVVAVTTTPPR